APGDFVSSPNWTWHDHGNEGDEPVIWFDAVDAPMIAAFNGLRFEAFDQPRQPLAGTSGWAERVHAPFGRSRQSLESSGVCALPTLIPTLDASLRRLNPGDSAQRRRSSASVMLVVYEGHGHSTIGEQRFDWQPFDVLVVPSGTWHEHTAAGQA